MRSTDAGMTTWHCGGRSCSHVVLQVWWRHHSLLSVSLSLAPLFRLIVVLLQQLWPSLVLLVVRLFVMKARAFQHSGCSPAIQIYSWSCCWYLNFSRRRTLSLFNLKFIHNANVRVSNTGLWINWQSYHC